MKEIQKDIPRGEVMCLDNKASCFCLEPKGHEGLHKCPCGGSWDKDGVPHSYPDISRGVFPLMDWQKDLLAEDGE